MGGFLMNMINTLKEFQIMDINMFQIASLFGILFVYFLLGRILKKLMQKLATKAQTQHKVVLAATLNSGSRGIVLLFLTLGISCGFSFLKLSQPLAGLVDTFKSILFILSFGNLLYWLMDVPGAWFQKISEKSETKFDDMLIPIVQKTLRITLVIFVLVQIAQILSDKPITSIIAGLGIGGLAVALAAQDSIKNFFGSIVLSIDRPFLAGDRIVIDGFDGLIEKIGLRSTRIITLDGHLVTIPNGELANKTIQNIGKRPFIRRVANICITYDTPSEKIDMAIKILNDLLKNHEGLHPDYPPRVHFNELNSDSLNIQIIYWYHPPDYWDYMAFTEKFNKEVFRRFNEEGINFAFPTQTVFLAGDSEKPLVVAIDR